MVRLYYYGCWQLLQFVSSGRATQHSMFSDWRAVANLFGVMQSLRSDTSDFQSLVQDLHNFLERVYTNAGERKKRSVSHVDLAFLSLQPAHTAAFEALIPAIEDSVTLAPRYESKSLCIIIDASDTHWSGIVTRALLDQLCVRHVDQSNDPLAFHSGRFSRT